MPQAKSQFGAWIRLGIVVTLILAVTGELRFSGTAAFIILIAIVTGPWERLPSRTSSKS